MTLKLSKRLINQLFLRRFLSKDSSLTPTDGKKELTSTTEKPSEISTPKRAFTLIDPRTVHQIKRIDEQPINNTLDYLRHRLTENRRCSDIPWDFKMMLLVVVVFLSLGVKNIPIETDILIIGVSLICCSNRCKSFGIL